MATKKDKLEKYAEHLFINEGWTQKAIAEYLEVSERSVFTWKGAGEWEAKRANLLAAPHTIKSILLAELNKVSKGEESKVDADALSKIHKVILGMSESVSPYVVSSVLREFDLWMTEQDPGEAIKRIEWNRKFILFKINMNG